MNSFHFDLSPVPDSVANFSDLRGYDEQLIHDIAAAALTSTNPILLRSPLPGCGAAVIARRVASLLHRHLRAPHHTISTAGLVGKIKPCSYGPRQHIPGELHIAQGGVLFLDQIMEFRPQGLRALSAHIARGSYVSNFHNQTLRSSPARLVFHLVEHQQTNFIERRIALLQELFPSLHEFTLPAIAYAGMKRGDMGPSNQTLRLTHGPAPIG